MNGIINLSTLLATMKPAIMPGDWVFCTVKGTLVDYVHLNPLATFVEAEGLTLLLSQTQADHNNIAYSGTFKQITLTVNSSLEAVGLTAAIATQLTEHNISANVVAAYYHDHIFIPIDKAQLALAAINTLSAEHK
ncbi:ACT domain-containing protein [Shewanella sp. HL-SH2]|uniref:ACT domain-containing protein n=1 Tax=Shewanella sp. HL-SH2 TaxID=3436238 RepID=UPI003EC056EE